jgi:hypothetical protein
MSSYEIPRVFGSKIVASGVFCGIQMALFMKGYFLLKNRGS